MTTTTIPAEQLRCTHDGIHGPDSEPGAVQRCGEETIALRVEHSDIGQEVNALLSRLTDELLPALVTRTIRETMRLADREGNLTGLVMDPADDYGRTRLWDPEGLEGLTAEKLAVDPRGRGAAGAKRPGIGGNR